jgi:hypothetical protein
MKGEEGSKERKRNEGEKLDGSGSANIFKNRMKLKVPGSKF